MTIMIMIMFLFCCCYCKCGGGDFQAHILTLSCFCSAACGQFGVVCKGHLTPPHHHNRQHNDSTPPCSFSYRIFFDFLFALCASAAVVAPLLSPLMPKITNLEITSICFSLNPLFMLIMSFYLALTCLFQATLWSASTASRARA